MTTHDGDDDRRAPTQEEWERMTPAEREAAIAALPSDDELIAELLFAVDALEKDLAAAQAEIARLGGQGRGGAESAAARIVRFERHEGSGHPLRAVYPDGSWLGVNRDHRGLYSVDARGRIVQILGADEFHAVSPRQFVEAYLRAFGQRLEGRAEAPDAGEAERMRRAPPIVR